MSLQTLLDKLSEERTWHHLTHITEQIPSRLAGTPNARSMAEYAAEQLGTAGLNAGMDEFLGLVSFPKPAEVRVLLPEEWTIEASTLAQSPSTDGLEAELVYVGAGTEAAYRRSRRARQDHADRSPLRAGTSRESLHRARHGTIAQVDDELGPSGE